MFVWRTPREQVVVSQSNLETALREMLRDRRLLATASLSRDLTRVPMGLVADRLSVSRTIPSGRDFELWEDWITVARQSDDSATTPEGWIDRLRPGFAQLLVVLLIGFGRGRRNWRGWTIERGVIRPLAGLQIVGPAMIKIDASDAAGKQLGSDRSGRYSRTVNAVGRRAFRKLRRASVAVVGCSRSGSLMSVMLAALGIKRLALIDGDRIEPHNLDGILFASKDEIGENKAMVMARHLTSFRPEMNIRVGQQALRQGISDKLIGDVDLVVTCVDRDGPRLLVSELCQRRLIPQLDLGSGVTSDATGERQIAADIRLLLPRSGCVRCVGGVNPNAEFELWAPPGAIAPQRPEPWNARGRLGSLVTVNSVAVATGIQTWISLLSGELPASVWHRIAWDPVSGWESDSAPVTAAADCPSCQIQKAA